MTDPRIIDSPLGPVIPVIDIAKQVGCSRTTLSHTMQRHPALFKDVTSIQWLETPSGRQKHTCIAKSAVEDLISHLRPINRDNLPERIDTFRAAQIRKNSAVAPALSDILAEYARQASVLAKDWDVNPAVAQKVSMATAVERYPDLMPYRALVGGNASEEAPVSLALTPGLQADPDYDKFFSLRKLAQICQCEEKDARKILVDEGVIAYQNTHLILTHYGDRFGKIFKVTPEAPHRIYEESRIRYSPDAVQLVRGKLFCIQTTLTQGKKATG